jgi:hypothetical protein
VVFISLLFLVLSIYFFVTPERSIENQRFRGNVFKCPKNGVHLRNKINKQLFIKFIFMEDKTKRRTLAEEVALIQDGYKLLNIEEMPFLDRLQPGQSYFFKGDVYPLSKHFLSAVITKCRESKLPMPLVENIGTPNVEFVIHKAMTGVIDFDWFYYEFAMFQFNSDTEEEGLFIPKNLMHKVRSKLYRQGLSLYTAGGDDLWKVKTTGESEQATTKEAFEELAELAQRNEVAHRKDFAVPESTARVLASRVKKNTGVPMYVSKLEEWDGVRVFAISLTTAESDLDELMYLTNGTSVSFRDTERPEAYLQKMVKNIIESTGKVLEISAAAGIITITAVGDTFEPDLYDDEELLQEVKEKGMVRISTNRMNDDLQELITKKNKDKSMFHLWNGPNFSVISHL